MKMSWHMYVAMLVLGNLFVMGLGVASSINRIVETNEQQMNVPTQWKYRMPRTREPVSTSAAQPLPGQERK